MRTAISRFRRRIEDVEQFDPKTIESRSDPRIKALEIAIDEALSQTFGHETADYIRYRSAATLDRAAVNFARPTPLHEVIEGLVRGKGQAIGLLYQAIRSLQEKLREVGDSAPSSQDSVAGRTELSEDVFIVHGRDVPAKTEVARLIERAGLTAVILHEQPNAGRTIIEKFEDYGGSAGFAVVLLTPDDVGGPAADQLRPRARQNVVGELFWFVAKLGRKRVCALRKGQVEIPSDFAGVIYTDMDDGGAWKSELLQELKAAGYEIDWAKALA
jgi:predicted nucleotide-binding protein